jgi:hypothetical protein
MINTITQITQSTSDGDNMYIDLVKEQITNYIINPLIVDENGRY